jgi:hypothetical protein
VEDEGVSLVSTFFTEPLIDKEYDSFLAEGIAQGLKEVIVEGTPD